ncbi:hypothetical protein BN961_03694 [Afipia felis]|uniref:Uncharacterized protein n=1 Tax=Afipia felis TaxID=1035 RepID=A0A090MSF3_AFIFE|nr:hypothetical protein BN961_03694 [Afipia felis]
MESDAAPQRAPQVGAGLRGIAAGHLRQRLGSRRQSERLCEIVGAAAGFALGFAKHDHLLAFGDKLAHQRDDPILAGSFAADKTPNERPLNLLIAILRVKKAEMPGAEQQALLKRNGPLRAPQEPRAEPLLKAVRVPDHSRKRDQLGLDPLTPAHPDERQNELQIRAAATVGDHLRFVDHDRADLRQHMRECQRDRGELLIGQETDIVLAPQQRRDVVRLARRFHRADPETAIDALEVPPLVCHKGLKRQQKQSPFAIQHVPERRELAHHRLARGCRGRHHQVLAVQHAEVGDGGDLKRIQGRDRSSPGGDKRVGETGRREAGKIGRHLGRQTRREGRPILSARHEHGPRDIAVDAPAHGRVPLFAALQRGRPDAARDMLEEAVERELAAAHDFLGAT